jgi:hypothetical protein
MDKKKNKIFKRIFILLVIIFLCLYSISIMGYRDKKLESKTLYTEEMIEKFENDVLEGKEIDINDYTTYEENDYSNKVSKFGEFISNCISYGAEKSIEVLSDFFRYLFE